MSPDQQNQHVVDLRAFPPAPTVWPNPAEFDSFSEWLQALTSKRYGVKQKTLAEVAGRTPQAVTKWMKGGMVEAESLVRIAEWSGFPYMLFRRLLDEEKLGVLPRGIEEQPAAYAANTSLVPSQFVKIWARLDAESRDQLYSMAKLLASKSPKKTR